MAEWSKAPDSSSGLRERAWVQIPLLTFIFHSHLYWGCNSLSTRMILDDASNAFNNQHAGHRLGVYYAAPPSSAEDLCR
ncbi:unnamed protein product [Linum tenue]|uniref:Uncharacterized protein n=1 Tax=Linum tenue TaxID=586396 RepID=A0AAV0P5C8_9ROSI|nr:unnamed protein product [Linum tenue]